eukprot:TRINITY_DN8659_c0_g1_i2.p1 TRINITY_DN8659_c0_g1~~TRINITY_DN8659_c0_g1_i2.p1  ORF type:complete len:682 (+),score=68.10 TRINITY_DN8659_c0_g1_i2:1-2046(+)
MATNDPTGLIRFQGSQVHASLVDLIGRDVIIEGGAHCAADEMIIRGQASVQMIGSSITVKSVSLQSDRVSITTTELTHESGVALTIPAANSTIFNVLRIDVADMEVRTKELQILNSTFRGMDRQGSVRLHNTQHASIVGNAWCPTGSCRTIFANFSDTALRLHGPATLSQVSITNSGTGIQVESDARFTQLGICPPSDGGVYFINNTAAAVVLARNVTVVGAYISTVKPNSVGFFLYPRLDAQFQNSSQCAAHVSQVDTYFVDVFDALSSASSAASTASLATQPFTSIGTTTSRTIPTRETLNTPAAASESNNSAIIVGAIVAVMICLLVALSARRLSPRQREVSPGLDPAHAKALRQLAEQFKQLPLERSAVLSLQPSSISEAQTRLGEGAFGEVYRCELTTAKGCMQVAVKTLKPSNVLEQARADYSDERLAQFYLESEVLLRMQHPHVVRGLGLQHFKLPVQLCLEFCDGGDLLHWLRGTRKTFEELIPAHLDMAQQTASGIQYLHKLGVIHRDIAARNVLLDSSSGHSYACGWQLKLSDLGMARGLRTMEDYYRKKSDDCVPLRWQDPIAVANRRYTQASDVFSFGVVIWEIFSNGRVPYDDLSAVECLKAVSLGRRLDRPTPHMPAEAYDLMRACMLRNEPDRPTMRKAAGQLFALLQQFESWDGTMTSMTQESVL